MKEIKTTLLNWEYYYADGMTMASDLVVDWRLWHVGGSFRHQWYDSIQGLDRYQFLGLITDDFRHNDAQLVGRIDLTFRISGSSLELGLDAETIDRQGRPLDLRESRTIWKIGYVF